MKAYRVFPALFLLLALLPGIVKAQPPQQQVLLQPKVLLQDAPTNAWPTYNGDYSGRRFSPLTQISASSVHSLKLVWMFRSVIPGGIRGALPVIKSTPLMVHGILYFTVPNHVYAVDARTGQLLWQFKCPDWGGHPMNRGVGMYGNWLYFMATGDRLISLDAKTGKQRWIVQVADPNMQYFTTTAPIVVGDHVILGTGGDAMDVPGYIESRDPRTGALQWQWYTEARPGEPEAKTWPNAYAMEHGGGMPWYPGTYDPKLNLYYFGTGNPNPVMAGQSREGADLWTASIVALNPDTGKLVWYFQGSPHDTHDWDDTEAPVLVDANIDGKPRKLLVQAARNGYFFVLDRTNGKNILSKPFVPLDWSKGVNAKGEPIPNPARQPTVNGSFLRISGGGGTNWMPPSYSPLTGLFYVNATVGYSVFYLTQPGKHPLGYAGTGGFVWAQHVLEAIDIKTGDVRWRHPYTTADSVGGGLGGPGALSTAGNLLFTGDYNGNFIAYNATNGSILWHFPMLTSLSNGPETYTLDGRQYVVAGAGDTLYVFALPR
jgi:acido-empty-quinoprotein group A